ncbi:hypothetical protein [Streptomyces sp. SID7909]|uniref:hypothetical protein n=1 Tax=Streptomyces sp. SID7909 TaxID=2706092 RepID=UPI0013BC90FC|nr:hypothetical protein [Streptomyces sp. SID7909]NEC04651.1 hypothetical protein [Streptomyces sp. SID7909]
MTDLPSNAVPSPAVLDAFGVKGAARVVPPVVNPGPGVLGADYGPFHDDGYHAHGHVSG